MKLSTIKSDSVPLGRDRSDKIKLNVGGKHFVTTVGTLCKEESMLSAMFEGKFDTQPDADGEVSLLLTTTYIYVLFISYHSLLVVCLIAAAKLLNTRG